LFLTLRALHARAGAGPLNHLGKTRIARTARCLPTIPRRHARKEIWSYGHRKIESAAIDPHTRHCGCRDGPEGGDELNLIEAGKNFGWPVVSWGKHYDGRDIPDPPTHPEFADAVKHWTPVISPSGMLFYSGAMFPRWRGHMLIGGLSSHGPCAWRSTTESRRMRSIFGAACDIEQAPDGSIYVLTDEKDGDILRPTPA
jgi:glucose/arabinose dehydrogenase